jgi:predicted PurR-regulated permease PerM
MQRAPTDQDTEVVPPAEEPEEMPLPSDPKVIFLGGLFVLALLATAYVTSEIVLPLVFAIILKLLLQPAMRILERWHVPRILAAMLLILTLFGTIVGLGTAISGPAGTWAAKLPEGIPRLQERLGFMREPINTLQRFLQQVENFGETGPSPNAAASARGPTLLTKLFTGTRNFASGLFTTVLFLFFLLVSGDVFLHRLVEILPRFSSKRPGRRNLAANRKRHLRVSGHDHDHERGSRYRHGVGDVAHGSGRPDPLGDGRLSAKLCTDPRPRSGRGDLSSCWPVDH